MNTHNQLQHTYHISLPWPHIDLVSTSRPSPSCCASPLTASMGAAWCSWTRAYGGTWKGCDRQDWVGVKLWEISPPRCRFLLVKRLGHVWWFGRDRKRCDFSMGWGRWMYVYELFWGVNGRVRGFWHVLTHGHKTICKKRKNKSGDEKRRWWITHKKRDENANW